MARYKVGDKVWIREDMLMGQEINGSYYQIDSGETDIRGKLVEIIYKDDSYYCEEYKHFYDYMIDHTKTAYHREVLSIPQYEIY